MTPIVLLSRFQLPLSWLDPLSGSTDGLPGLLFSANIPSLEEDLGHHDDPPILVSRSVDGGDLYAIERVKEGIYALCGLGDWISDSDVLVASKRWLEPRTIARRVRESDTFEERDGLDWRQAAEISDHDLDMGATEMQTDVDICMVFGPDQSFPGGTGNNTESINPSNAAADTEVALPTLPGEGAETGTPSVAEVLERLRAQYLEALYVAKVRLRFALYISSICIDFNRLRWGILPKDPFPAAAQLFSSQRIRRTRSKFRMWPVSTEMAFYLSKKWTSNIVKLYRISLNPFP